MACIKSCLGRNAAGEGCLLFPLEKNTLVWIENNLHLIAELRIPNVNPSYSSASILIFRFRFSSRF